MRYEITAAILEIYNETVVDLLAPGGKAEIELVHAAGGFELPTLTCIGAAAWAYHHCPIQMCHCIQTGPSFIHAVFPETAHAHYSKAELRSSVNARPINFLSKSNLANFSPKPMKRFNPMARSAGLKCCVPSRPALPACCASADAYRAPAGVESAEQIQGIMASGFEQRGLGATTSTRTPAARTAC